MQFDIVVTSECIITGLIIEMQTSLGTAKLKRIACGVSWTLVMCNRSTDLYTIDCTFSKTGLLPL